MAKFYDDTEVLDPGLTNIKTNVTTLVFCSAQPANYAGIAAVALATKTGIVAGDFTLADGNTGSGGRMVTVAAKTGMVPSANGTVAYVVGHNGTKIYYGTAVTSQPVTTAQTWDSPSHRLVIGDPT